MRELTRGLVLAVLALLTIIAGLALALSETRPSLAQPTAPVHTSPTETLYVPSPVIPTAITVDAMSLLQTAGPIATPTPCPPPPGWQPVNLHPNDTWAGLAASNGVSVAALLAANCATSDTAFTGATVYLPAATPLPAPTVACGPPAGWVFYTVQSGDTLFALSRRYGVAIYDLQLANCLPGVSITVGQNLYVPPVIVETPSPLPSAAANSPTPTFTSAPNTATSTSQAPSATNTASATPTLSPTLASTNTPLATAIVTTSVPASATPTYTDTATASTEPPTATETPTATTPAP